jgi:hypothetical protein
VRVGARGCALLLLCGSAQSRLRRKLMVRRRVGSWQLAVGSRQLDVAIANGPSFRSVMAENATIDGDVVCATSSSLLTARRWSSRDWWMVDGGWWMGCASFFGGGGPRSERDGWRASGVRGSGFWVLGSGFGFCLDSVSKRGEWSAPRTAKRKSTCGESISRPQPQPAATRWIRNLRLTAVPTYLDLDLSSAEEREWVGAQFS